jgi:diguanylate cyclase (GGDEF)-like protein
MTGVTCGKEGIAMRFSQARNTSPSGERLLPSQAVTRDVLGDGFPLRLLTAALVLTIATFAWFAWVVVDSGRDQKLLVNRLARVEQLQGVIVHLDEVLTMSTRMAAETGDPLWEERYRQFEGPLAAAIEETMKMGRGPAGIGSATRTNQANIELVKMESRAFALIRAGRREEARAALLGREYGNQKALYTEGVESFVESVRRDINERLRREERLDLISVFTVLGVAGVSFLAWLVTVRGIQRWRLALEASISDRTRAERVFARDVGAARAITLEMTHTAQHDFLTGLPNRMLLHDRIGQAIAVAPRHKKQVALLFLDLNGFKAINDTLGHSIGDKLLQSVAKRLKTCVRSSDTVSRLGGDEFVVLLSEAEEPGDAGITSRRILEALAETHYIDQHFLHVTTSIGISVYPQDGLDAEALIRKADSAMYLAKESGRDTAAGAPLPDEQLPDLLPFHGSGESRGWKRRRRSDSSTAQVGVGVRCVRCEGKALGCLHDLEEALVAENNQFD